MKMEIYEYLTIVLCLSVQNVMATRNHSNHKNPLCLQCECLGIFPFLVDCSDLNFKEMPEISKDLKSVWRLQLQGNALTRVPAFIHLENLTSISFRYNQISEVEDAAFFNLTKIRALDLSHNNITANSLTSEVFRGPYHDELPDPLPLQDLCLSHNHLRRLQKHVFKHLTNLTSLDLSYNPLIDLSIKTAESISELQTLRKLDLSYTKLRRLPQHFFSELIYLEELDLSGNNFIVVPQEINFAHSLRKLYLNDNIFGVISADSFWKTLEYLEHLQLKGSETLFRVENGAFGNLTSLETLWLSDNLQLSDLFPLTFTDTNNRTIHLQELHLENNHFENLPENALAWKDIPYLNLQGNPWNCDCNFEWLAKDVLPVIQKKNMDLTVHVTCAQPLELMGERVVDSKVQEHHFVCPDFRYAAQQYGFVVVATIVVGTLLLVTGTIIFSYVLFRRTKAYEWAGDNVKYRRTFNDDEENIASSVLY